MVYSSINTKAVSKWGIQHQFMDNKIVIKREREKKRDIRYCTLYLYQLYLSPSVSLSLSFSL